MTSEELTIKEISCQHHWMIETGTGPTSKGIYQRCGAEKEFENSVEYQYGARNTGRGRAEK